jgi:hypothetical protein
VIYQWYYAENDQVAISSLGSYSLTSGDIGKTFGVRVTVDGLGEADWEADGDILYNGLVSEVIGYNKTKRYS